MKKKILAFSIVFCCVFIILTAFFISISVYASVSRQFSFTGALGVFLRQGVLVGALLCTSVITGIIWCSRVIKKMIEPINRINFNKPQDNDIPDELSSFWVKMKRQNEIISKQSSRIQQHQVEFSAISNNMREGLVLLNGERRILTVNKSALNFLHIEENPTGQNVLSLNRSQPFCKTVDTAFSGAYAETILDIYGKYFQLIANPIVYADETGGVALMLLDVTEREDREKLRREFTANVSHELKTPLTAISGYAEILSAGMAAPEDVPQFANSIYKETQRLISLIGDIMTLSRLDERNVPIVNEDVDLLALAHSVAEQLSPSAQKRGVSITVTGESTVIRGLRPILYEILLNLTDNAIKYNVENGRVEISAGVYDGAAIVTVTDTGIGIPPADRERVFERFYRADKGRGGNIEGTGLGLSIAKHGAMLHNGEIEITSDEGGTAVTLRLPALHGV